MARDINSNNNYYAPLKYNNKCCNCCSFYKPESLLKKGTLRPRKSWRSSPDTRTVRNKKTTPWTLCCITIRETFDNFDKFLTLINSSPESLAASSSGLIAAAHCLGHSVSGQTSNINDDNVVANTWRQWVF